MRQRKAKRDRRLRRLPGAVGAVLSIALAAGSARAENFYWVWADGNFSDPLHWIPYDPGGGVVGPPGPGDNAIFTTTAFQSEGRVSFDYSPVNAALFVNDLAEQFDLQGHTYGLWWETGAYPYSVNVGFAGDPASLTLMNGTVSAASSALGHDPGWVGTVTVDAGAVWTHSGNLAVGVGGEGYLHVHNGGSVSCVDGGMGGLVGSFGMATVDGNDSRWACTGQLHVGVGGTGSLLVAGGGRVDSTVGHIAELAGSTSQATVTGAGSGWETGDLYVGGTAADAGGAGTLFVADGGHVEATGTLKMWPGGTVALDGGSITTRSLDNGHGGTIDHRGGTLTVQGGSFAPGGSLTIDGNAGPASPQLVLDGATVASPLSQITVASTRQGRMTVRGGTQLTNTGDAHIGQMPGSDGAVDVTGAGSTWTSQGSLSVGGTDAAPGGAAMLSATGGGHVQVVGSLRVGPDGTLRIDGGQVTTISYEASAGAVLDFVGGGLTVGVGTFDPGTADWSIGGPGTPTLTLTHGATADLAGNLGLGTAGGAGALSVLNGARADVGGTLAISAVAALMIDGGEVHTGLLDNSAGGALNWPAGVLGLSGGLAVDSNDPFGLGAGRAITPGRVLEVVGALTMGPAGELNVDGGLMTAGSLDNSAGGTLNWHGGTLRFPTGLTVTSSPTFGAGFEPGVTPGCTLDVIGGLTIGPAGGLRLNGGSVTTDTFDNSAGGAFDWDGGTLRFVGDLPIDTNDPFGLGPAAGIAPGRVLEVSGALTVGPAGALRLEGGRVTTASFDNSTGGTFAWNSGTLHVPGDLAIDSNDPFGLGPASGIAGGCILQVDGAVTIGPAGRLGIAGGQVTASSLDNSAGGAIALGSGALTLVGSETTHLGYGAFAIGDGAAPPATLVAGEGATVVFRDLTIPADGALACGTVTLTGDGAPGAQLDGDGGTGGTLAVSGGTVTLSGETSVISLRGGDGGSGWQFVSGRGGTGGTLSVSGGELTVSGASGVVNVQGGRSGQGFWGPNHSGAGGTLSVSGGMVTLAGTVNARGGPAKVNSGHRGAPGGTIAASGGQLVLDGVIDAQGSDGDSWGGYRGNGGAGGKMTVSGGIVTVRGTLNAQGGYGGAGGGGGEVTVSQGAVTVEGTLNAYGGNGESSNGGAGGRITVSGGSLALEGQWRLHGGRAGEDYLSQPGTAGAGGTLSVSDGEVVMTGGLNANGGAGGPSGGAGGAGGAVALSGGVSRLNEASSVLSLRGGGGGYGFARGGDGGAGGALTISGGAFTLPGSVDTQGGAGGHAATDPFNGVAGDGGPGGDVRLLGGEFALLPGARINLAGGAPGRAFHDGAPGEEGTFEVLGGMLAVDSTAFDATLLTGSFGFAAGVLHLTDSNGYTVGGGAGLIGAALGGDHVRLCGRKRLVLDGDLRFAGQATLEFVPITPAGGEVLPAPIDASGDAVRGGVLRLTWPPASPQPGDSFGGTYDVITCDGELSGSFGSLAQIAGDLAAYFRGVEQYRLPNNGGCGFAVILDDLIDADADLDGDVDYDDYAAARDGFAAGGEAVWGGGDFSLDGAYSAADYLLLKASFGRSLGAAAPPTTEAPIPEPASIAVLAVCAAALAVRPAARRRHRTLRPC